MVSTATLEKWIAEGDIATEETEREYQIVGLTRDIEALAKDVVKREAETALWRFDLGLKFIELRELVQANGNNWTEWFPKHVHGVDIRTAYRYMALATRDEPLQEQPNAPVVTISEQPLTDPVKPAKAKETAKKDSRADEQVSAKVTIGRLVKRLDEDRARELLAKIREWTAQWAIGDDDDE